TCRLLPSRVSPSGEEQTLARVATGCAPPAESQGNLATSPLPCRSTKPWVAPAATGPGTVPGSEAEPRTEPSTRSATYTVSPAGSDATANLPSGDAATVPPDSGREGAFCAGVHWVAGIGGIFWSRSPEPSSKP